MPFTKRSNLGNPLFEAGFYSAEVLDLIKDMLRFDPRSRPSASEILAHPWVLRWSKAGISLTELRRGITRLREVPTVNPLRATYMRFVVDNVLDRAEVEKIQKVFTRLNTNHNGVLQMDEMLSALRLVMSEEKAQSTARRILPSIGDGIDYSSFLLTALSPEILSSTSLRKAFLMLSGGSERHFSIKELAKEEKQKPCNKKLRTEGKISFERFQSFMRQSE
jgi:serine/threonine protein kinase